MSLPSQRELSHVNHVGGFRACCDIFVYFHTLGSGRQVPLERNQVTWPGARIKKKKEGLPSNENWNIRGNLVITFDVGFPRGELTSDQKEGAFTR